jgi:hypothetical protein
MKLPPATTRYRAVSMELAADLDAQQVEMHILTDTGETIAVVCRRDSIFTVQRHIEKMANACPEIATWRNQRRASRSCDADVQSCFLDVREPRS